MEAFDTGTHCQLTTCKNLDFLPFVCDKCSLVFCSEHRTPLSHNCSNLTPKESTDLKKPCSIINYPCSVENCDSVELVPVLCSLCKEQVCLSHRIPEDHNCIKLKVKKKPVSVSNQLHQQFEMKQPKSLKSAKARKMSAKLALMKLKLHSIGSNELPEEERAYFFVHAHNLKTSAKPFFVCKSWTVGKVVDFLANKLNLSNQNHVINCAKLRLCSADSGDVIMPDVTIQNIFDNELLFNGSAVILKYVEETLSATKD